MIDPMSAGKAARMPGAMMPQCRRSTPRPAASRMPRVGESTVPPTTIFAFARKPPSALVTGGSHAMPPDAKGSSSARARASLPAT